MQIATLQVSLSRSSWPISTMNQSPMSTTALPQRKSAWRPCLEVTTSSTLSSLHHCKRILPCNPCHSQLPYPLWMYVRDAQGLAMSYARLLCQAAVAVHSVSLCSEEKALLDRQLQVAIPTLQNSTLLILALSPSQTSSAAGVKAAQCSVVCLSPEVYPGAEFPLADLLCAHLPTS